MEKSGLLLVNKEKNMTSHDCVNIVRRSFNTKKVGHAGTLDPMATGLLPICIGKATKTVELISMGDKEYTAEFLLGITTDTLDITGEVLTKNPPEKDEEKIISAINSFKGGYMQLPPMYSAKKINGKKLYELAREGKTIERTPSYVEIKELDILEINTEKNIVKIRVLCSKGTYIRSLIDDIGAKLACGAAMTELIRTGCAGFSLDSENIISISELKNQKESLNNKVISLERMFENYPLVALTEDEEIKFRNGIRLRKGICDERIYRITGKNNELLALGKYFEEAPSDFRLGVYKSFY